MSQFGPESPGEARQCLPEGWRAVVGAVGGGKDVACRAQAGRSNALGFFPLQVSWRCPVTLQCYQKHGLCHRN